VDAEPSPRATCFEAHERRRIHRSMLGEVTACGGSAGLDAHGALDIALLRRSYKPGNIEAIGGDGDRSHVIFVRGEGPAAGQAVVKILVPGCEQ
jgi:hypothetical protein